MIKGKDISPEVLQKVKEKEFEILCAFDDFCKENDIKYSLAYGTLLGAVRHGGFIPWDDDIDIIMNKENFDKLVSAWEVKHPDNYCRIKISITIIRKPLRKSDLTIQHSCRKARRILIITKAFS